MPIGHTNRMVSWLAYVVGVFALISIGGGIQGFVGSNSVPSLMGGAGAGLILFLGLYIARTKPTIGYAITTIVSLGLAGMMLGKYMKSHAVWPAGVIAFGGIAVVLAHIVAHFMSKKAS